jgi:hypothetical protein
MSTPADSCPLPLLLAPPVNATVVGAGRRARVCPTVRVFVDVFAGPVGVNAPDAHDPYRADAWKAFAAPVAIAAVFASTAVMFPAVQPRSTFDVTTLAPSDRIHAPGVTGVIAGYVSAVVPAMRAGAATSIGVVGSTPEKGRQIADHRAEVSPVNANDAPSLPSNTR